MSAHFKAASAPWTLSVSLLKEVTVTLHTADGRSRRVPISPNARRIQLLAYLAWRRDQRISREQLLTRLFAPDLLKEKGLSDKEFKRLWRSGKEEKRQLARELGAKFAVHKKLLRRDIRAAAMQLNAERESDPLPTNLDPFEGKHLHWGLSSLWQVIDLETVEAHARDIKTRVLRAVFEPDEFTDDLDEEELEIIEAETRVNRFVPGWSEFTYIGIDVIPESVKAACDALLAAYPGDFLEEMLRAYPDEFKPLKTSWVREPYTLYRDYYLLALWYAGEYEWRKGRAAVDGPPREHFERAAEHFRRYAMYACNSRLDTKVSFGVERYDKGIHVVMSEAAMCYCLSIYQTEGMVQEFEACKQAYMQQMERISRGIWKPGDDLQKIIQAAIG